MLIAQGFLQQAQAYQCLQVATQQRRSFLTVAVEMGYLSMVQASAIHNQQAQVQASWTPAPAQPPEKKTAPLDRSHLQQQLQASHPHAPSSAVTDSQVPFRPPSSSTSGPIAPLPLDSNPASSTSHPRAPSSKSNFSGEGMLPAPGDLIDGYQIKSLLGRGGMGAVFLAEKSGQSYAIKVITTANAAALTRFEREAQAAAKVGSHPNVVSIHKYSQELEIPFIVMDFVSGKGLDTLVDSSTMSTERALELMVTIAEALAFIHSRGLLHRDLKPANILIRDSDQEPLITDFGLARQYDAQTLTKSTDVIGTPHYMSPEQAGSEHDAVDESSDVWALGVILYELITKKKPFAGETMLQIARNIMFSDVTTPSSISTKLNPDLETVILKALAKDKSDRYKDAASFARDLRAVQKGDPVSATRLTWVQIQSRKLRRRLSAPVLFILFLLLVFLLSSPILGYLYWAQKQTSGDYSSRIEKVATPFEKKTRLFNQSSDAAITQKLNQVTQRSAGSPLWDSVIKGLGSDYEQLRKLRNLVYEAGYPESFDHLVDPKKWSRAAGNQAIIDALNSENPSSLKFDAPMRPSDKKLAEAIVALRQGKLDDAASRLAKLESKSSQAGRLARYILALIALDRNGFEEGLGRLAQLRDVEGLSESALVVLTIEWPRSFVYNLFERDESSLRSNLNSQFNQMRDFAKTLPKAADFWQGVNDAVNKQFEKEGPLKDRRRRIAKVFELLKAKSLTTSELKCPRLTRALHLALARRIEARYDEKFPAEMRKALFHHLSIQRSDDSYSLPPRYKSVLDGLAAGSIFVSHREAYNDILVVTRLGVYLPYVKKLPLEQFELKNLLDGPIAQNPADFAARFWRGMLRPLNKRQKKELGRARVEARLKTSLNDIQFVIDNSDTPTLIRGLAHLQRADLRIEEKIMNRSSPAGEMDQAFFQSMTEDCQAALRNWHPEPDQVYEMLMRLESRYKGMKTSTVKPSTRAQLKYAKMWVDAIHDRFNRTNSKTLAKGRPQNCPMAGMVGYRNKLRSAYNSLSRAYQAESKHELAAQAAEQAIKSGLKSDEKYQIFESLYELIESLLQLKKFKEAEDAYRAYYLNPKFRADYSKDDVKYLNDLWRSAGRALPGKKP